MHGLFQLAPFLPHVRFVRFNEGVCPEHIVLYMLHLVEPSSPTLNAAEAIRKSNIYSINNEEDVS